MLEFRTVRTVRTVVVKEFIIFADNSRPRSSPILQEAKPNLEAALPILVLFNPGILKFCFTKAQSSALVILPPAA
jgi:hypothetical protein